MLKNKFFSYRFYLFFQSGLYWDFFTKKNAEVFVRNVFLYTAQFLGEKYLIEFCTKILIERFIVIFERLFIWDKLPYTWFFFQIFSFLFYFIAFSNLIILFF